MLVSSKQAAVAADPEAMENEVTPTTYTHVALVEVWLQLLENIYIVVLDWICSTIL